jgi:tetratricopeptide (TPR) repeat protein
MKDRTGVLRASAFGIVVVAVVVGAAAIDEDSSAGDYNPGKAAAVLPTPAVGRFAATERSVLLQPSGAERHVELALTLARTARDTADVEYYARADREIDEALRLAPNDFEALKARAWVLLGRHRFADALALATTLNARTPDDVMVYGLLTDAHVELGNYEQAEEACQWMLDLRPGNVPALTRAAHLRELFGDIEGAIELMTAAFTRTAASEVENRAWLLTQLSHLALLSSTPGEAERLAQEALALLPDYHYALAQLARVRTRQGRLADAATLLERRLAVAPHPENRFELARALVHAGASARAEPLFAQFERDALAEADGWDNANRELVAYYLDHAHRPADALRIAASEATRRQDVYTLTAWASALHANGRERQARELLARVIAVGTKDPDILARAATITEGPAAARRGSP